ncbi:MAG: hypothetical protein ABR555_12760 [Pyrinomonadaceae bacterium]
MTPERKIVIDTRFTYDGEYKKYRSTQEQIQQNQREKLVQRERDERARSEANSNANGHSGQENG